MPDSNAKRAVKVALSSLLWATDRVRSRIPGLASVHGRGVVLLYHSIPERDRERFGRQLDALVALGEVVSLDELLTAPGAAPRFAITFDDALDTLADVALAELQRRGLTATVFVPTGALAAPPRWAGADGSADAVMSAERLGALPESIAIGSHTRTHVRLSTLGGGELATELAGSLSDIRNLGAGPAMHLAFPYGDCSPEVAAAAVAAGYNHLWTVEPKPVASGPSGDGARELLGRVTVDADDWPIEYRLKTAGSYRWIAWFMTAKRRRASAVARTAASGG